MPSDYRRCPVTIPATVTTVAYPCVGWLDAEGECSHRRYHPGTDRELIAAHDTPPETPEHDELLTKAESVEQDLSRAPWDSQVVTCNARDVIADLSAALRATSPVTPPVCATCNDTRIKPWEALTDDERAPWAKPFANLIPCPDCTEDTPDAEV